jgi:hypothetical protein
VREVREGEGAGTEGLSEDEDDHVVTPNGHGCMQRRNILFLLEQSLVG